MKAELSSVHCNARQMGGVMGKDRPTLGRQGVCLCVCVLHSGGGRSLAGRGVIICISLNDDGSLGEQVNDLQDAVLWCHVRGLLYLLLFLFLETLYVGIAGTLITRNNAAPMGTVFLPARFARLPLLFFL